MCSSKISFSISITCMLCLLAGSEAISEESALGKGEQSRPDYLQYVKSYANALLENCRDTYGDVKSPLIAAALDRNTMKLFEGKELDRIWHIRLKDWDNWRVRNRDRSLTGANPMHDENLYQILYALTKITGDKHYADEADRTLKWFFENCQSPITGLLAWGEHIGWDFTDEYLIKYRKSTHHGGTMQEYNTHEFARPWVLWKRCFEITPEACERFAVGLWNHQIGDHNTGNFSRHANYEMHQTSTNSEYPRHGGFYIATWAQAYENTRNPFYLKAIEMLVDYFDSRRSPESDGLPAESAKRSKGLNLWAGSNLSLAIDLHNSAEKLPDKLSEKLRKSARRTDAVFLKLKHQIKTGGKGFLLSTNVHTLEPYNKNAYSGEWAIAGIANLCMLRYKQIKLPGYKKLILDSADFYVKDEPQMQYALHPGTLGQIIYLLLNSNELTGQEKYLNRTDYYARRSIELFFDETSPLPKATSKHNHYEAVTRADTLMMSLLRLWVVKNKQELNIKLVYCDR